VINIKDVDDEENNHKWEEDEDEMLRIKASNQEKHKEFEHKESEPQEVKTFKKPQGRRFTSKYKNTDTEHQQESQTPPESQYHQQHHQQHQHHQHQPHHFKKQKSAALNFAYKDYREITHTASNVTTVDLLRMLIVRSSDDGQIKLKRCLEDTLRAINLECKFPTIPRFNQQSTQM
jgi:hypothetical protein